MLSLISSQIPYMHNPLEDFAPAYHDRKVCRSLHTWFQICYAHNLTWLSLQNILNQSLDSCSDNYISQIPLCKITEHTLTCIHRKHHISVLCAYTHQILSHFRIHLMSLMTYRLTAPWNTDVQTNSHIKQLRSYAPVS